MKWTHVFVPAAVIPAGSINSSWKPAKRLNSNPSRAGLNMKQRRCCRSLLALGCFCLMPGISQAGDLNCVGATGPCADVWIRPKVSFGWGGLLGSAGGGQDAPGPGELLIGLDWVGGGICTGGGACDPPDAQLELTLLDCNNEPIQTWQTDSIPISCDPSGVTGQTEYKLSICKRPPKSYKLREFTGISSSESDQSPCMHTTGWNDPEPIGIAPPLDSLCEAITSPAEVQALRDALSCLVIGQVQEIPDRSEQEPPAGFAFYKRKQGGHYTLYTQPPCESGCDVVSSPFGELVKGVFKAETPGLLLVEVQDDADGLISTIGLNNGVFCAYLVAGAEFQFGVQTGQGDPTDDFKLRLDWYKWEQNQPACTVTHQMRILQAAVEPMCPVEEYSSNPQAHNIRRGPGESEIVATEVRIPMCPSENCSRGNLSKWFVLWPETGSSGAPHGFAKGWRLEPAKGGESEDGILVAPGPDGMRYAFEYTER